MPQDFTSHDLEFIDGVKDVGPKSIVSEQIDKSTQKDTSKIKENPYWFEDLVNTEQHYHSETVHHHHHHHNTRRAKRNHYRKLKTIYNNQDADEKILTKRSIHNPDENTLPDEIYSPSEVVGNIFNENDTVHRSSENGKDKNDGK